MFDDYRSINIVLIFDEILLNLYYLWGSYDWLENILNIGKYF